MCSYHVVSCDTFVGIGSPTSALWCAMECDLTEYVNTQSIGRMRQCEPVEKQLQVLVVSTQLTLSELKKTQTQSDTSENVAKQLTNLKCSYCIAIKVSGY